MIATINTDSLLCVVRDIGSTVMAESGPQEVARMVSHKFIDTFEAEGATMIVLTPGTGDLDLELHLGNEFWYGRWDGKAWSARAAELDLSADSVLYLVVEDPPPEPLAPNEIPKSVLDLPFRFQDGGKGFIRLYFNRAVSFGQRFVNTLKIMLHQGACAMEKSRLIQRKQSEYNLLAASTEKLSALGQMAAGVAHEINNPLAGILLFSTNLLKKAPPGSPFHEGLEIITEEVMRCKNIITELLEFSREKEPTRLKVELNNIIAKAVKIIENEYRLRHITLETRLAENLPEITVDPSQMEQVMVNLLLNAAEAAAADGLVVVESRLGRSGERLDLIVSDDGCGIEAHNMSSIFDPFFSTKSQGTGLGLAVIYGLIRNHQGTINVSSKAGEGTTFTVSLPLDENDSTGGSNVWRQAGKDTCH